MSSVLRPVRKRKKSRTLGPVDVIRREDYGDLELDAKVELIRSLVPLGLMHVEEMLDDEVTALAGARYARKDASIGGRRHGSNPGTVGLAGQRVPIRVPRIRRVAGGEIPLRSYAALHGEGAVNDRLLTRMLYGISCRNYAAAAEAIPGAIGLSGSTVSRTFIQASAAKLHEFHERDLSNENVVAIVLDGKTFAEATMVIALGITMTGEKRFLGFVETDTENAQVLTPFLRSLLERGLDISQGVLVILDGGKGLRAAVRKAFRRRAVVQRCQWHKRENVVSYLAKTEQPLWRQRLQRAYHRPEYDEAVAALRQLHGELEDRNQSAARSLTEGFDETLTLQPSALERVRSGRALLVRSGGPERATARFEQEELLQLTCAIAIRGTPARICCRPMSLRLQTEDISSRNGARAQRCRKTALESWAPVSTRAERRGLGSGRTCDEEIWPCGGGVGV